MSPRIEGGLASQQHPPSPPHPFAPPTNAVPPPPTWQMVVMPCVPHGAEVVGFAIPDFMARPSSPPPFGGAARGGAFASHPASPSRVHQGHHMLQTFEGSCGGPAERALDDFGAPASRSAKADSGWGAMMAMLSDLRLHMDGRFANQAQQLNMMAQEQRKFHYDRVHEVARPPGQSPRPTRVEASPVLVLKKVSDGEATEDLDDAPLAALPRKSRISKASRRKGRRTTVIDKEADEDDNVDHQHACVMELEKHLQSCGQPTSKPEGRSGGRSYHQSDEEYADGEGILTKWARKYAAFVRSDAFDYGIGLVIMLNTAFLGVQVDLEVRKQRSAQEEDVLDSIETAFVVIFLLELLARLSVDRLRFWCSLWNLFDLALVLMALLETAIKYGVGSGYLGGAFNVVRSLRIVKVMKTFRVVRVVRAFRELRVVVMSIARCFRSLFWTLLLLFVVIYIVAVLILVELSGMDDAFVTTGKINGYNDLGQWRSIFFPNLPRAMYTLFQCVTGGLLWSEAALALEALGVGFNLIWIAFVAFVIFTIGNIMCGIFVDHAIKSALDDVRNVADEEHDKRMTSLSSFRAACFSMDKSGSGFLTRTMLVKFCDHPTAKKFCQNFDIDSRDIFQLFDHIADPSGKVSLADFDDFSRDCMRLKGLARNSEVVAVNNQLRTLLRKQRMSLRLLRDISDSCVGEEQWPLQRDDSLEDRDVASPAGTFTAVLPFVSPVARGAK